MIQDHCQIRLLPYHPQVWVDRAATFLALGYGELAAADAYKAHLLCFAASVDELKAREPGDGSLTAKVFSAILSTIPQAENQSSEAYYLVVFASIERMHEQAYLVMAQGLLSMSAWDDALAVLIEAIIAFPKTLEFKKLRRQWVKEYWLLANKMRVQGKDDETIKRMLKSGQLERVAYPWIGVKELERSVKGMKIVNAQFEAASENACIGESPVEGASTRNGVREENFGVFAKSNIQQGETILLTRSIWTDYNARVGDNCCSACCQHVPEKLAIQMTCCTSKYCSETCMQEAKKTYHNVICGKDFSWLYKACKEADQIYSDKVPLMLVKILATAVHLNCKPLKVPCVRTLKANYDNVSLSKFTLFDNIVAPIQILETLGVDIFTNLKFDSWALQTVITRIENNRVGKKTLNNRPYNTVDPLFSMFNHSCMPSAAFNFIGGSTGTMVKAVRDIKQGEEICISYVEPRLPEGVRRDKIWKRIGRICDCLRCRKEREVEERQRFLREREAENARRFLSQLRDAEAQIKAARARLRD